MSKWWEDGVPLGENLRQGIIREPKKVCRLYLDTSSSYWKPEGVEEMISCLEKRMFLVTAGVDSLNPLEKLALHVLMSSAGLEIPKGREGR